MIVAIWIIAVCEIVRVAQTALQLFMIRGGNAKYENACDAFVKSLKDTDKEFVRQMLEKFDESSIDGADNA